MRLEGRERKGVCGRGGRKRAKKCDKGDREGKERDRWAEASEYMIGLVSESQKVEVTEGEGRWMKSGREG